jgi:hypothetical protein
VHDDQIGRAAIGTQEESAAGEQPEDDRDHQNQLG